MRLLIISKDVGRTASGIVFERLIHGLSPLYQTDILTSNYNPSIDLSKVCNTVISKLINIHPRIYKLLILLFGINFYECIWAWKSIKLLKSKKLDYYDLVLCFLSSPHSTTLITGEKIAKNFNCKYIVYSVDAIPAPGWTANNMYNRTLKKMMAKYLRNADGFFSANDQMLAYQLSIFEPSKSLISGVLYNPSFGGIKEFPKYCDNYNNFVYTGGIYGARKVKSFLEGFEKLLREYPDSQIIFIGDHFPLSSLSGLNPNTLLRIKIDPYTIELDTYYASATALIDIDADIVNDVFLSSKIINYIMINRIIISETGANSPSRHLFKGIDSIFQCDHDSLQLYEAMKKAIEIKDNIKFEDRKSIIELFSLKNIIKKLNNSLSELSMD